MLFTECYSVNQVELLQSRAFQFELLNRKVQSLKFLLFPEKRDGLLRMSTRLLSKSWLKEM